MKLHASILLISFTIVNLAFSQEVSEQIKYGGLTIIDYSNHGTAIHEGIKAKIFEELLKYNAIITDAAITLAGGVDVHIIASIRSSDVPLRNKKELGVQAYLIITIVNCSDGSIIAIDVLTSPLVYATSYQATKANAAIASTYMLIKEMLSSLK